MMTRVCWLVRSFVGWFAMLVVSSIFIIFGTDVERQKSKTILTFQKSRSKPRYLKCSNRNSSIVV